jgi:hypothetical protein
MNEWSWTQHLSQHTHTHTRGQHTWNAHSFRHRLTQSTGFGVWYSVTDEVYLHMSSLSEVAAARLEI